MLLRSFAIAASLYSVTCTSSIAFPIPEFDGDTPKNLIQITSEKPSFFDRLKRKFPPPKIEVATFVNALQLGIKYGKQAAEDEANGYEFAHQKAAYDWGYEVGDPKTVKLIRIVWEAIQLGVFGYGDFREEKGDKSEHVAKLEAMVGGNGKDYTVNRAYMNDIFDDVQIAVDGAMDAQNNVDYDFKRYAANNLK